MFRYSLTILTLLAVSGYSAPIDNEQLTDVCETEEAKNCAKYMEIALGDLEEGDPIQDICEQHLRDCTIRELSCSNFSWRDAQYIFYHCYIDHTVRNEPQTTVIPTEEVTTVSEELSTIPSSDECETEESQICVYYLIFAKAFLDANKNISVICPYLKECSNEQVSCSNLSQESKDRIFVTCSIYHEPVETTITPEIITFATPSDGGPSTICSTPEDLECISFTILVNSLLRNSLNADQACIVVNKCTHQQMLCALPTITFDDIVLVADVCAGNPTISPETSEIPSSTTPEETMNPLEIFIGSGPMSESEEEDNF